jgi:hypothetical protein
MWVGSEGWGEGGWVGGSGGDGLCGLVDGVDEVGLPGYAVVGAWRMVLGWWWQRFVCPWL